MRRKVLQAGSCAIADRSGSALGRPFCHLACWAPGIGVDNSTPAASLHSTASTLTGRSARGASPANARQQERGEHGRAAGAVPSALHLLRSSFKRSRDSYVTTCLSSRNRNQGNGSFACPRIKCGAGSGPRFRGVTNSNPAPPVTPPTAASRSARSAGRRSRRHRHRSMNWALGGRSVTRHQIDDGHAEGERATRSRLPRSPLRPL